MFEVFKFTKSCYRESDTLVNEIRLIIIIAKIKSGDQLDIKYDHQINSFYQSANRDADDDLSM